MTPRPEVPAKAVTAVLRDIRNWDDECSLPWFPDEADGATAAVEHILRVAAPHMAEMPLLDRGAVISVLTEAMQEANRRDIRALAQQGWPGIPEVPANDMRAHCANLTDLVMPLVRPMPTAEQLDGWLSDHDIVWRDSNVDHFRRRVQQCACGWKPDSWETDDEFDEYYRDHRATAVLALMNGAKS
jgi:hypothetical protein